MRNLRVAVALSELARVGDLRVRRGAFALASRHASHRPCCFPTPTPFSWHRQSSCGVPFVDGYVFSAALEQAQGRNRTPGKVVIEALDDPYLEALAMRPKRAFSLPTGPWLTGPLAPLVTEASEPRAPIWSPVGRGQGYTSRAGVPAPVSPLGGNLVADGFECLAGDVATQTRKGRRAVGESFGLVLLEAQAAGTPVIAPAYSGPRETYIEGVTGVAPADESVEALTRTLHELLKDPARLAWLGRYAVQWTRQASRPRYWLQRRLDEKELWSKE